MGLLVAVLVRATMILTGRWLVQWVKVGTGW